MTRLHNYHCYLIPEQVQHPESKLILVAVTSHSPRILPPPPAPSPPTQATINLLSLSMDLPILESSHQSSHTTRGLSGLASFPKHHPHSERGPSVLWHLATPPSFPQQPTAAHTTGTDLAGSCWAAGLFPLLGHDEPCCCERSRIS